MMSHCCISLQVVSKPDCSVREGCLAACIVTQLMSKGCVPRKGEAGDKLLINPQHLLPFAKAVSSQVAPDHQVCSSVIIIQSFPCITYTKVHLLYVLLKKYHTGCSLFLKMMLKINETLFINCGGKHFSGLMNRESI